MHEALGAAGGQRRARAMALLLALSLCTAAASSPLASSVGHIRKLHRRDMPRHSLPQTDQGLGMCNNTVQGRWLLTDSHGFVCARSDVDVQSGCCSSGEQFTCKTCNLENQCCEEYEHCVSCCQAPQHSNASVLQAVFRGPDRRGAHCSAGLFLPPETGHWGSVFEYCRGKCRTSSKSTVHENAYLSPLHHCFSASGKPTTPSPPGPPLPAEVVPVAAEKGASCAAACEAAGRRCAPEHFAALNDCNRLREHYACEAGCEADAPAPEYPAYVDAGAPKAQRPTMCLLLEPATLAQASCEAANAHVRRLCPCAAVAA